jgi:hypothetical protein
VAYLLSIKTYLQVNSTALELPSKFIRLASIALYCFGPLGIGAAMGKLTKELEKNDDFRSEAKEQIVETAEMVGEAMPLIR